jgi:hypothetical protein
LITSDVPAHAHHPIWGNPCAKFFFEEAHLVEIDIVDEVNKFVNRMKVDGYGNAFGSPDTYQPPTNKQRGIFETAFKAVRDGKLDDNWRNGNCKELRSMHYVVRPFKLRDTGRPVTVLYEIPWFEWTWNPNSPTKNHHYDLGWGFFVVGPPDSSELAVEVTHACPPGTNAEGTFFCNKGDRGTHVLGAEAFRFADARYLLINGAPRPAAGVKDDCDEKNGNEGGALPNCPADMAHNAQGTIFQLAHELATADAHKAYQPHGWNPTGDEGKTIKCETPQGTKQCDTVVSSGLDPQTTDAEAIVEALQQEGFLVCLYDTNSGGCHVFGATNNVQKLQMETAEGKSFISVEVKTPINIGTEKDRLQLADLVAGTLTK